FSSFKFCKNISESLPKSYSLSARRRSTKRPSTAQPKISAIPPQNGAVAKLALIPKTAKSFATLDTLIST
ncbi:MAG: hypothetical protein Q3W86_04700, partial [Evtepia sp.]|nr:hypothetical protein [Evtepia sp.]